MTSINKSLKLNETVNREVIDLRGENKFTTRRETYVEVDKTKKSSARDFNSN